MILPAFTVRLEFHGDLHFFLKQGTSGGVVERCLSERTSVKDVIESCGVPHPEVNAIRVNGTATDFSYVLENNSRIDIYPVEFTLNVPSEERLQKRDLSRFVADCHLGKLTRNLRLLGFDVVTAPTDDDRDLLELMQREARTLITRDRRLLMHRIVRSGFYPRSQEPDEQTVEVLRRFQLMSSMAPFTRCPRCNGILDDVAKAQVLERLEPLTRRYYDHFRRCRDCGQIYWPGSHFDKLCARIEGFRAKLKSDSTPPSSKNE